EAGDDPGDDRVADLAARIVVGDHDLVGQAFGNGRHLWALAGVALAAAAKYSDQPPAQVAAQRFERLLQRIGLVRVIDDHQRPVVAAETVYAPRDGLQPAEHACDRIRVVAE